MENERLGLLLLFAISFLNYCVWHLIQTPLNNELLELHGKIVEINTSSQEMVKYFIHSLFLTVAILLPFYRNKSFTPRVPYLISAILFVTAFTMAGYILDQNIKGVYLVKYMGDDFPFSVRIIEFFMFFPVAIFILTTLTIKHIRKRNIFVFFCFGIIATLLSFGVNGNFNLLETPYFRKAVSQGSFIFWFTFFIGLQFWLINKEENPQDEYSTRI